MLHYEPQPTGMKSRAIPFYSFQKPSACNRKKPRSSHKWSQGSKMEMTTNFHRNTYLLFFFQIKGFCDSLMWMLQVNQESAPLMSEKLLEKYIKDYRTFVTDKKDLIDFPDVESLDNPADVLLIADFMRSTILSFFSPEELEESKKAIGFLGK